LVKAPVWEQASSSDATATYAFSHRGGNMVLSNPSRRLCLYSCIGRRTYSCSRSFNPVLSSPTSEELPIPQWCKQSASDVSYGIRKDRSHQCECTSPRPMEQPPLWRCRSKSFCICKCISQLLTLIVLCACDDSGVDAYRVSEDRAQYFCLFVRYVVTDPLPF